MLPQKFKKIGISVIFILFFLWPQTSQADYCALGESDFYSSDYRDAYCNLRLHKNQRLNDDVFRAVADQVGYSKEIVEKVLTEGNLSCGNEAFAALCAKEGRDLNSLNRVKENFRKAYEKEKALQIMQRKLEIQFKASEKYWDGRLGDLQDAPFDLMNDLNLLETALFGSRAQWTYDVFKFPVKEGGGETEEIEGLISSAGEEGEDPDLEGAVTAEPGLNIGRENCVPNQPEDALCGNGAVDILVGESCDDGNQEAGDGCSPACLVELGGSSNVCFDAEAVTFRNWADVQKEEGDEAESACPPGTHASGANVSGGAESAQPAYPQSPNYPGPFVGGTFKKFPESNRPACPVGQSEIKVDLINGQQESACIPTKLCGDFNQARDFLFGADWENSEDSQTVKSIEALFCVEVVPHNRPLTPYGLNEGCIDCHVHAMADKIEEALTTNVTPLENTMNAFSISNRWGPNFSFNLDVIVRSKAQMSVYKRQQKKAENQAEKAAEEAKREKDPGTSPVPIQQNSIEVIAEQTTALEESEAAQKEAVEIFSETSSAIQGVESESRIKPMLSGLESRFAALREIYASMAESATRLASKDQCTF